MAVPALEKPERMRRCEVDLEICLGKLHGAVNDVLNSEPDIVIVQDPDTVEKLNSIGKRLKKECYESHSECLRTPRFIIW